MTIGDLVIVENEACLVLSNPLTPVEIANADFVLQALSLMFEAGASQKATLVMRPNRLVRYIYDTEKIDVQ